MTIKLSTDIAKDLRKGLKQEFGLNRNHVSVRTRGFEVIIVELKTDNIDAEAVEKFVKTFEDYERDAATGEILCGGNTFIHLEQAS